MLNILRFTKFNSEIIGELDGFSVLKWFPSKEKNRNKII